MTDQQQQPFPTLEQVFAAKKQRAEALQQAFQPERPMDPGDYYRGRAQAQKDAIARGEIPGQVQPFPSLSEAYKANKPALDEQRQRFEQQRREDPYFFNGQDMPRPRTQAEKYRLVNGGEESPHPAE